MSAFEASTRYPATIAGTALSGPAWFCLNPEALLTAPPSEGQNISLPGVNGTLGRLHTDGEAIVDLLFEMTGSVTPAGTANANHEAGLAANKRAFTAAFFRATRDAYWCVEAVIEDLDGTDLSGPVQPMRPLWSVGLEACGVTMTVKIPRELVEGVGSA